MTVEMAGPDRPSQTKSVSLMKPFDILERQVRLDDTR